MILGDIGVARVLGVAGLAAGPGWQGKDGELKLDGRSRTRRVVVMRRACKGEVLLAMSRNGCSKVSRSTVKRYELALLVTDLDHGLLTLAPTVSGSNRYENAFDDLRINGAGWVHRP